MVLNTSKKGGPGGIRASRGGWREGGGAPCYGRLTFILRLSFSSWYTYYVVNLKKSLSDTLFYRGAVKVTFKSE